MRLLKIASGLALVLGLAAAANAAPLDPKQVPAEAKWLMHVDVDAMRQATVVQKAWKKGLEMHKEAQQHLDKLKTAIGMDICKDLHGVTAYGRRSASIRAC